MLFSVPPTAIPLILTCLALLACAPAPAPSTATDTLSTNLDPGQYPAAESPLSTSKRTANEMAPDTNPTGKEAPRSYDFETPEVVFELPKVLKEISGLSVLDENYLAAVQDEKGRIYKISIHTGDVESETRFAGNGDFEGVELAGDDLYALRSDGDIYRMKNFDIEDAGKKTEATKYETFLRQKHDTEGLAYDRVNNRLLVVCKEDPGAGLKNSRAVYAFDLDLHEMQEEPVLVIDLGNIENLIQDHPLNNLVRKLTAPVRDLSGFKPAAIAIHPVTGQTFVVSSVRKMLLAFGPTGQLEDAWQLSEDRFRQPEGLAFMPNGDLFIANEGGNGRGTLMRFNYR